MTMSLSVYDPAMCCSTGVCGPSVDQNLVKLASDLGFIKGLGVEVKRFNLGHQPEAFASSPQVLSEMGSEAENLPIFIVDGEIKSKAVYPDRREIASWFGLEASVPVEKPLRDLKVVPTQRCC